MVDISSLHQARVTETSQLQQILPLLFNAVDAVTNLPRPVVISFDKVMTYSQYCWQVRVTRVHLILIRLHPNTYIQKIHQNCKDKA